MKYIFILISICLLIGCNEMTVSEPGEMSNITRQMHFKETPQLRINVAAFNREPSEWGENVIGVKNRFVTDKKEIALTFDLCGGEFGNGYDEALVAFLREAEVPATLFVNERWIVENEKIFTDLAADPLFQIENHGTTHAPLSITGNEAWGIKGTGSPEEVIVEVMKNHETIKALTGREMKLFRSGTAYYDEVAVELVNSLGYEVVNFDILGDAGATFSAAEVEQALLESKAGSIALLHMNQPTSGTAEGVAAAVPQLRDAGFEFVLLDKQVFE